MKTPVIIFLIVVLFQSLDAQKVGINLNKDPEQTLEVGGMIFTNSGGIMFPDSSIQTTAATLLGGANPDVNLNGMVIMVLDTNGVRANGPLPTQRLNGIDIPSGGFPLLYYYEENDFPSNIDVGGSGGGAGKAEVSNAFILRNQDFYSGIFHKSYFRRDVLCGDLYFIKNPQSSPEVYMKLKFYGGFIFNIQQNVQHIENGQYNHLEALTLQFSCIKKSFYQNNMTSPSLETQWSFIANNAVINSSNCPCN